MRYSKKLTRVLIKAICSVNFLKCTLICFVNFCGSHRRPLARQNRQTRQERDNKSATATMKITPKSYAHARVIRTGADRHQTARKISRNSTRVRATYARDRRIKKGGEAGAETSRARARDTRMPGISRSPRLLRPFARAIRAHNKLEEATACKEKREE